MRATIDAAGRVVVPKFLREALGLRPGQELELQATDGRLELEPVATPMHLAGNGADVYAVTDVDMPELTAEQVRETLEQIRR